MRRSCSRDMRRSCSRDRVVLRLTADDSHNLERMREILLGEPHRGVPSEPTHLLGNMYIGSQKNAESLRLLRRLGITHVLNCAGFRGPREFPNMSPYEGLGIDYLEFLAEDVDTYDMTMHFREAFAYLDKVKRKGGIALVHCAMGVNRSAAVCVGYMMHDKSWPLLKVTKMIKDKRSVVLSNKGFQIQLVKFAKSKGLLEKPERTQKSTLYNDPEDRQFDSSRLSRYDRNDRYSRNVLDMDRSDERKSWAISDIGQNAKYGDDLGNRLSRYDNKDRYGGRSILDRDLSDKRKSWAISDIGQNTKRYDDLSNRLSRYDTIERYGRNLFDSDRYDKRTSCAVPDKPSSRYEDISNRVLGRCTSVEPRYGGSLLNLDRSERRKSWAIPDRSTRHSDAVDYYDPGKYVRGNSVRISDNWRTYKPSDYLSKGRRLSTRY